MNYLSMVEARLPPGFRFHPGDDELVVDYLSVKMDGAAGTYGSGYGNNSPMMVDVDLNKCEPWDLPDVACVGGKEWYFFSQKDRKYATGQRTNRATVSGYWKATGKDRAISRKGTLVGMRKTLVFYQGRAPKGKKTDWVMHEFRKETAHSSDPMKLNLKEDWVLCRVFYKSRGTVFKPTAAPSETCPNEATSTSLPPLVDNYINFEQAPQTLECYEQVPCYSILPPHVVANTMPPSDHVATSYMPSDVVGLLDFNPGDDNALKKAVFNHPNPYKGIVKKEFLHGFTGAAAHIFNPF